LDHDATVNLVSVILARRLKLFKERDLQTVAEYVEMQTHQPTYWDDPRTYISYSPLGIYEGEGPY